MARQGNTMTDVARVDPTRVVGADTLAYLGLDPRKPETRAMVLLAERYKLDPLLGHVSIISTRNGFRPYVTRDGLLEAAHRSGQLDGIVVDEERRNSENDGWTAYVSVWRKDCAHPFRYGAQCKDNEPQAKQGNGPEMALARAERRALKRAFNIVAADEDVDIEQPIVVDDIEVRGERPAAGPGEVRPPAADQGPAHAAIGKLPKDEQDQFLHTHGIEHFGDVWPQEAVDDALERSF